jgi:hypothetical protein
MLNESLSGSSKIGGQAVGRMEKVSDDQYLG